MKKKLLIICLIMISFICIGCETEPSEYDPKSKGWELWISGVVDEVYVTAITNKRTYVIKFKKKSQFTMDHFYNFEEIKEKTKGSIYKWTGCLKETHYYMWVPSNDVDNKEKQSIISKTVIDPIKSVNNTEVLKPLTKYEWQDIKVKLPSFNQTVLVKFKNKLVTTAYYTQMGVWKAEVDRKKMSGGISLKNIVQWKSVDLE